MERKRERLNSGMLTVVVFLTDDNCMELTSKIRRVLKCFTNTDTVPI